jgi:hypothetical protein
MHVVVFSTLGSVMVSKHSELTKRQARDHYGRFSSPSSRTTPPSRQEVGSSSSRRTAPPPSCMQEVGSSSHRRTAPPRSRQEEAPSDDSVEMWVVAPPPTPPTHLGDSSSTSSGYNDRCPHVREVSSYKHCF